MIRTSHTRAWFAALAMTASMLFVTVGLATPAAASGLSAAAFCESDGGGTWDCFLQISGGTAPYTVTWTAVTNATVLVQDGTEADGSCAPSVPGGSRVTVTVTDSLGNQTTTNGRWVCTQAPR